MILENTRNWKDEELDEFEAKVDKEKGREDDGSMKSRCWNEGDVALVVIYSALRSSEPKSDRATFPFVGYSCRFLRNNAINNLISLLFSRTACFSLEEYCTAKTAFEAGCKLAPDDARFTYRITKCEKCIAGVPVEKNDDRKKCNDTQQHFVGPLTPTTDAWPFVRRRVANFDDSKKVLTTTCDMICSSIDPSSHHLYYTNPFFEAIRQDAIEVVKEILYTFPNAVWSVNENGHNIIQYAVINRSENIYNILPGMSEPKNIKTLWGTTFCIWLQDWHLRPN
ncbi:hypothetical protein Tco_1200294 [Tanacetum coccineum]